MSLGKIGLGNAHYFKEVPDPKLDEIKKLLESTAEKEKLEGMKRLIAFISKGRDVSSFFPNVVKNVVCQNVEVKRLVYMYLVHYAEFETEAALLAINTFQKDLNAHNQLIRSQALRVMSSIRVKMIAQIVILAIKKCVNDPSPYVRKTAAHAIPKVYSVDPDQAETLTEIIKDLLRDKSTMVLGSVMAAFNEICPDRFDLLHPHYRKLCNLLADIDEWGQLLCLNILIRYARTQFLAPERPVAEKRRKYKKNAGFYSDESDSEEGSAAEADYDDDDDDVEMDPDHRLLLRSALPLLHSRNNGVVVAVAGLYYYLAPSAEAQISARSLVRLVRASREIAYSVLLNIVTLASKRPEMFAPYLVDFFINDDDASFVRDLKLEILTYIASPTNIHRILREFNVYVHSEDKDFASQTIKAIGRCAVQIPEVIDSCMHGLMGLLVNRSETIVAESVVVLKMLLQMNAEVNDSVIARLAKLLPSITEPKARASIIWVIGEYNSHIPLLAPDIFRTLAKSFTSEMPLVKLQVLNLGAKLVLANPEQTKLLFEYVLNLAKYDMDYDLRDRARFLRALLTSKDGGAFARKILVTNKPAPVLSSKTEDRIRYCIGSLSHAVNHTAPLYEPIADFPEVAPDPSVRDVQVHPLWDESTASQTPTAFDEEGFYSDESDYSDYSSGSRSGSWSRSRSPSWSGSRSRSRSYSSYSDYSRSRSRSRSYSRSPSPASRSRSRSPVFSRNAVDKSPAQQNTQPVSARADDDPFASFLGSVSDSGRPAAGGAASLDGSLSSGAASNSMSFGIREAESARATRVIEAPLFLLLSHANGGGLGIQCRFLRRPSIHGVAFSTLELVLKNHSQKPLSNISVGRTLSGDEVIPFSTIVNLPPGQTSEVVLSVRFSSPTQPVKFEIKHSFGAFPVTLQPSLGELVRPMPCDESTFNAVQAKLTGMNEHQVSISVSADEDIDNMVLTAANLSLVPCSATENHLFAARSLIGDYTVLVSIITGQQCKLKVNCDSTMFGTMLLNLIKSSLH